MKKCTSCGRLLKEDSSSCNVCGCVILRDAEQTEKVEKKEKTIVSILKAWAYTVSFTAANYAVAFAALIPLAIIYYDPDDAEYLTKLLTTDVSNIITLIAYVLFAVVLTVYFRIRRKNVLKEVGAVKSSLASLPFAALFGISANYIYSFAISVIPWPDSISKAHDEAYAMLEGDGNIILTIVTVAIFTGILEETVYRGLVMTRLKRSVNPTVACVISAMLFSIAHPSLISAVYTAVFGFCLALIFEKFSSVIPCIVAHVFFNLIACIGYPEGDTAIAILLAASAVIHVISVIALVRLPSAKAGCESSALDV